MSQNFNAIKYETRRHWRNLMIKSIEKPGSLLEWIINPFNGTVNKSSMTVREDFEKA